MLQLFFSNMNKHQTWYYHETFKQYLTETKNDESHFIVEEYKTGKFKILLYPNQQSINNDLLKKNKSYYNIFYKPRRHLYLDFDHYLKYELNKNTIYLIGKEIIRLLTNFYNIHETNSTFRKKTLQLHDFYAFNSSRCIQYEQYTYKLSLHVYSDRIIYEHVSLLESHIKILQRFINDLIEDFTPKSNIFNLALNSFNNIDLSVYRDIQYLRAYNCYKYNEPTSRKTLLYPKNKISIEKINKILNVDKNNLEDVSIYLKSLPSSNYFNRMQDKQITRLPLNNNKLSTTSSITSPNVTAYHYTFESEHNQLKWKEKRIYKDAKLISLTYTSINVDIEYPRLFQNLKDFPLDEIIKLNVKLSNPNIKIKDTYKILFTNWEQGKKPNIEYIIYFNKKNITLHQHPPLFIKKHLDKTRNKNNKSFSIYCDHCNKFFDL